MTRPEYTMASTPDPNRGPGVTAFSIVMIILPSITVALRVWSRLTPKTQRFWWDDWFAIASLPCVLAMQSMFIRWVSVGFGRHFSQLDPEKMALSLKYLYAIDYPYALGLTLPKYSAIFFYIRVLRLNSTRYRINVYIALSLVTAWILFAILSTIFECIPIRKAWLPLTPGSCLNGYQWYLGSAISSVIIDFYIMLLPLPVLWTLHTGRSRKMVLTGFCLCAYCVLTVSLGRLVVLVRLGAKLEADYTWNAVTFLRWVSAEGSISIVSICLPNMNYLAQRARHHGISSLFTRREYASSLIANTGPSSALSQNKGGFKRIGNDRTKSVTDSRTILNQGGLYSVSASAEQHFEDKGIAMGQVHMRQDINVIEDERWTAA